MSEITKSMIMQSLGDWGREERAFAVALGLKRARLSSLRREHLEEGVDWGRRKGKVVYRMGGESKMKGVVALLVGVEEEEVVVDEELGRADSSEEMEVLKVYPINGTLVECERVGGEKVRVNVGDNANFMKGMVMTARPPWGSGRLWVMVGRKPRRRGKW